MSESASQVVLKWLEQGKKGHISGGGATINWAEVNILR